MKLALLGGSPIRNKTYGGWPIYSDEEAEKLCAVLKSLSWGGIKKDSELAKFEQEFAEYHNIKYSIGVCNGTCALVMALKALGVKPGDEVIIPAMSFIATATAASLTGAIPVFVDINPTDHCMNIDAMEKAITPKTKAIIPVHIGGHPCEMDRMMQIAGKHSIRVVEDCAQAHGAEWKGKKVGTFGDIGVFSFAETKSITSGEGGALITNDSNTASRLAELRNHGRDFGMKYYHPRLGWNFRLSEFQAGILRVQLKRLDGHLERKNITGRYLARKLKEMDLDWVKPLEWNQGVTRHGLFSFAFMYSSEYFSHIPKGVFCDSLIAEGIPVGREDVAPFPIYENPLYSDRASPDYCECKITDCPNTVDAYSKIVITGQSIHSSILLSEIEDADDFLKAIIKIKDNELELAGYSKTNR